MLVIDELSKITELVREEHKKEINQLMLKDLSKAEQKQVVEIFKDVLYDELKYAVDLLKFEREKEKRRIKQGKVISIRSDGEDA